MRLILFDWIMEVCDEFHFNRETFHLATYYVDLYLSKKESYKEEFQLLGTAALLLAAKMEEVKLPSIKAFSKITENTFNY